MCVESKVEAQYWGVKGPDAGVDEVQPSCLKQVIGSRAHS